MRKALVTFFLGLILGFVLMGLLILFLSSKKYIDNERLYGFPEMVYYIMQSLSVLGTFLALLVAIFGNEIKSLFFSPKCEVYIVDDGFTEDLGQTSSSSSPSAQLYNCTLALKNTGSKELENLSLVIKDVHFVGESGKTKRIKKMETTLFWIRPENKNITLRETECREFVIARILPEASAGTPDHSSKSPLRFSITGVNIDQKYNAKGQWVVKYSIQTPSKIIKNFQVNMSWSGKWCNRINEMTCEVTSELKEIKA